MSYCNLSVCFVALLVPSAVFAHGLDLTCTFRGGNVVVEAYFDNGDPATDAAIKLVDSRNATVAEGRTDAEGKWSFSMPAPGNYRVVLDTPDLHRAEKLLEFTLGELHEGQILSKGQSRQAFTGYRWVKVIIGVVAIAIFGFAFQFALRKRAAPAKPDPIQ